jgi:sulfite exporter TauE/SafE
VTYDTARIKLADLENQVENLGYQVQKNPGAQKNPIGHKTPKNYNILGGVAILLILYVMVSGAGGLGFFNSFPEVEVGMGYGLVFLIGILTSVHCVAMCGGINLSQCALNKASGSGDDVSGGAKKGTSLLPSIKPSLMYNSGRVVSYTLMGGLVGALGSVVSFSPALKGLVVALAGIFMIIMGLNTLNIFPWLRRINPRMPKVFARKINQGKTNKGPFYVGMLNGLMPCGPLQAMQLYALSTGSALEGALSMMLFSLGTVPLMFSLGALSSLLTQKHTRRMVAVSGMLVILLGLGMLGNGAALSGVRLPALSLPSLNFTGQSSSLQVSEAAAAEIIDGKQYVTTGLVSGGYEPIQVVSGVPVEWTVIADANSLSGCNYKMIIPEYGIEKELQPGENIIEFTPDKTGVVPYSCWMGMIKSSITVE